MNDNNLPIENGFKPFERGIIIIDKPSFDTLQVEFSKHRAVAKRLPFILGDLLAYGELAYDAVDQMLEGDDYCDCPILNRGTAYNYKSVSLAWWPPERKVYDKPWSWYQATMSLPAELQDKIMQDAIRFEWNRDRLRAEVGKLQDEHGIKRHREQATYPTDREFDLMVENNELREQVSRMREIEPGIFTTQNDYNALKQTIVNQLKKWQSMPITEFIQNINDVKNQIEWLIEWIEQHE